MTTPLHLHRKFRTLSRRLIFGTGHGLLNGVLVVLVLWVAFNLADMGAVALRIASRPSFPPGSIGQLYSPQLPSIITDAIVLLILVIGTLPVGLTGGFLLWLSFPADMAQEINPLSTLRSDRNAAIFRSAMISLLILLTFITSALVFPDFARMPAFRRTAEAVLLSSVATGC